jgi:exonuclease VII small subunit
MGFSRFAEGGLELDEGDFADFEEAEAMYLDCMDILEDAKSRIKKDDVTSNNVKEIISTVIKYTDEELEYIEEMIGL